MNTANRPMTLQEWGLLVALSVLWGGSYFFIEIAIRSLPPLTVVATRLVLASCILLLVVRATATPMPTQGTVWRAFLGMGLLNNVVPFTLIVWAQTHISSSVASILNATAPLFTVVIAHAVTADERLNGAKLLGVVLGLAGVATMMGASAITALGASDLAQLAILGAALSYALASIYGRRFKAMGVQPLATATGQVIASSLMLVPLALWWDQPWQLPAVAPESLAAVGALALASTALAYVLYFRLLQTAGATNLLLVTFLIPVTAVFLGVLILGEVLDLGQVLGMGLIGLGLAAIDGRPIRRLGRLRQAYRADG